MTCTFKWNSGHPIGWLPWLTCLALPSQRSLIRRIIRTEQTSRGYQPTTNDVSETESDDDDDEGEEEEEEEEEEEADDVDDAEGQRSAPLRPHSPASSSAASSSATRLSTASASDSGIDGVSPRLSAATTFGEPQCCPSLATDHDADVDAEASTPLDAGAGSSVPVDASVGAEGDPRRDRWHKVALELLATERAYVQVLHLLDQVFQFRVDQENRAHSMFPQELIPQMFSNIKSLFKLHHDFLLPQLEERMRTWEEDGPDRCRERRIGDIFVNFAPFLKMYAEYVRNFDHATHLLATWTAKCPRFAALLDDIQASPVCAQLSLQHHMLTPIQRVPRYELLLREYLRRLPSTSDLDVERADTERALYLVATAARHANEAMQKIDQFQQLLDVQTSLGGVVDLVSPTRQLLREGRITKISARSGDHQERYLFLFTDLLLLCSPRLTRAIGVGLTPYRLRALFNIGQLQVLEGDNLETANTFYLCQGAKTVELYTSTSEEKEAWIDALFAAMTELTRRKSSLRVSQSSQSPHAASLDDAGGSGGSSTSDLFEGGRLKPTPIAALTGRPESANRCADCDSPFSVMRRKHHCHACGKVLCNRCSSQKVSLPHETSSKASRVCGACHRLVTGAADSKARASTSTPTPAALESNASPVSSPDGTRSPPSLRTGLLMVAVETPSVLCGYLSLKTRGRGTWSRRWFALRADYVLYSYRGPSGQARAITATPVPGFSVGLINTPASSASATDTPSQTTPSADSAALSERDRSFKMAHVRKSYTFQAGTREEAQRWVHYLQMASRADLPSPSSQPST